jgi:hypothetical protein
MMKFWCAIVWVACACEEPAPQGPRETSYQNGYAQTTYQNGSSPTLQPTSTSTAPITYAPTASDPNVAPLQIQTTPVPLGVEPAPLPSVSGAPSAVPSASQSSVKMAAPGHAAFQCQSDAQCLLGRCNLQYGRCAYPCKNSEVDCKAGNVCTAGGVCMPRGAAGVKM